MQYGGKTIVAKNTARVVVHKATEDYEFMLTSLPLGWLDRMAHRGLCHFPTPPMMPKRDKFNNVYKDKRTGQIELVPDVDDIKFLIRQLPLTRERVVSGQGTIIKVSRKSIAKIFTSFGYYYRTATEVPREVYIANTSPDRGSHWIALSLEKNDNITKVCIVDSLGVNRLDWIQQELNQ